MATILGARASAATAKSHPRFRYESDLVSVLHDGLSSLVFSHSIQTQVRTFSEVPAVHGIPDLASIRFDWRAIEQRIRAGIMPLSTDIEVRAVKSLASSPKTMKELATDMRVTSDYVRRSIVPLLEAQGWISNSDKVLSLVPDAVPVGIKVVTVEAKLRDWHKALGQARRQQLSADVAYIALDAGSVNAAPDELRYVAQKGIGIITVDAGTSKARIWARPTKQLVTARSSVGRMLIAERCFAMWQRGEQHGQIHPVFGWTRPDDLDSL